MAQVLVASLLRYVLKPPKKPPPRQSMRMGQPGDPESGVPVDPNVNPETGMTPEEEAYAAKRKKIMRIVWIAGGLFIVCWLLEIPLLPLLKQGAKYAQKYMKESDPALAGAEGAAGDDTGADLVNTFSFLASGM